MAKAQSELIHGLEGKVVERTKEATEIAARNARLEERNHLSQELHDAVSQTLFAANLIADTLPGLSIQDPEKAKTASREIKRLNKDALLEMRQLLLELRPEQLSANRFGQLLQTIKSDIEQNHQISVSVAIEGSALLPNEVLLAFYRVAQEGLVNAAKHAEANSIEVLFESETDQALLTVKDNGKGFSRQAARRGSLGLKIMEERMFNIGGSFEVESELGSGTMITAIWFARKTG
jgi:signal transduction histidine kinase